MWRAAAQTPVLPRIRANRADLQRQSSHDWRSMPDRSAPAHSKLDNYVPLTVVRLNSWSLSSLPICFSLFLKENEKQDLNVLLGFTQHLPERSDLGVNCPSAQQARAPVPAGHILPSISHHQDQWPPHSPAQPQQQWSFGTAWPREGFPPSSLVFRATPLFSSLMVNYLYRQKSYFLCHLRASGSSPCCLPSLPWKRQARCHVPASFDQLKRTRDLQFSHKTALKAIAITLCSTLQFFCFLFPNLDV